MTVPAPSLQGCCDREAEGGGVHVQERGGCTPTSLSFSPIRIKQKPSRLLPDTQKRGREGRERRTTATPLCPSLVTPLKNRLKSTTETKKSAFQNGVVRWIGSVLTVHSYSLLRFKRTCSFVSWSLRCLYETYVDCCHHLASLR